LLLVLVLLLGLPQVEPGVFRELHNFMQASPEQQGRIEVLSFAVTADGAGGLDDFGTPAAAAPSSSAAAAAGADGSTYANGSTQPEASTSAPAAAAAAVGAASRPGMVRPAAGRGSSALQNGQPSSGSSSSGKANVLYARGPVASIPEEYATRRQRFAELDQLQPGWTVELRQKGEVVDAVFFTPEGQAVGAFANARRQALQAHKQLAGL
jgi:hypothetical protein